MTKPDETESQRTPTPWKIGNVYEDGSGPVALRGPNNEEVLFPFIDFSSEPGEGLDGWGLEVSDEDLAYLVLAVNSHARLTKERDDLIKALDDLAGWAVMRSEWPIAMDPPRRTEPDGHPIKVALATLQALKGTD